MSGVSFVVIYYFVKIIRTFQQVFDDMRLHILQLAEKALILILHFVTFAHISIRHVSTKGLRLATLTFVTTDYK